MANHASAAKRHRQNIKRRARNRHVRSTVRGLIKTLRQAIAKGDKKQAETVLMDASRGIDRAVSKGIYHRKTGSRYISRLSGQVSSL